MMAGRIEQGDPVFIPFTNGASIYDSQLKAKVYTSEETYRRAMKGNPCEKYITLVRYVPVVCCKECKWNRPDILLNKYWCTHFCIGMEVRGDDFCSYGERQEELAHDE